MNHKRIIVAGVAVFVFGAAGLSLLSHAQNQPTEAETPAAQAPEGAGPDGDAPEGAGTDGNGLEAGAVPGDAAGPGGMPEADTQDISYTLGFRMGSDFVQNQVEVDVDAFTQGFQAALAGEEGRLSDQEMEQAMFAFRLQMQQQAQDQVRRAAEEGEAFLRENREAEGVQVTESGLQYKVIEEGEGPQPEEGDVVNIHYRGRLLNGQVFDDSYRRGTPMPVKFGEVDQQANMQAAQRGEQPVYGVDGLIAGWGEALRMMQVGDKWELYVPSDLGYGAQGTPGGPIPPHATLIFEIEMVSIQE